MRLEDAVDPAAVAAGRLERRDDLVRVVGIVVDDQDVQIAQPLDLEAPVRAGKIRQPLPDRPEGKPVLERGSRSGQRVVDVLMAGDLQGSLEAQFKLNPVRLSMDAASFPVAAQDMAKLRGLDAGEPYRPSLSTPEGPVLDKIKAAMRDAGLIE